MWSVEYANAGVGQTLDSTTAVGVDAEKRRLAASARDQGDLSWVRRADFEDVIACLG